MEQDNVPTTDELLLAEFESRQSAEVARLREEVAWFRAESLRLRGQVAQLTADVERVSVGHQSNARSIRALASKVESMRVDRQVRALPTWIRERRRGGTGDSSIPLPSADPLVGPPTILVVAPAYPIDPGQYGGQPIARRIPYYRDAGYDVVVFVPAAADVEPFDGVAPDGVHVKRAPIGELGEFAVDIGASQLAVHSPSPQVWRFLRPLARQLPTYVWIHGAEGRNWRDLSFDFSASELAKAAPRLDALNVERRQILAELFAAPNVTTIFVSDYMRQVAEEFAGCGAGKYEVIHNVIDLETFEFEQKTAEQRFDVVMVRSFARRNYATDLGVMAIARLSEQPWFDQLKITVVGDGRYFEADTAMIDDFSNVELRQETLPPTELAALLRDHGVALLPTRWDSQGMMMGEAMAAGLVPVTNAVTAIPEFVDQDSGWLAGGDDVDGLVDGIRWMVENPDDFVARSRSASARVSAQCGPDATVARELELFGNLAHSSG